ncbi:MAG TPA: choice-of-anchor tandem repeat GloVer-containing protein [Verrucomicrobiae bacterium]|nr:choice-of-anchor tandem repeat GloVer-containing protein [Verrucomicrobiae bacterium]
MKTQSFFAGFHVVFLTTLAASFLAAPSCAQPTNFQRLHSFGNTNLAGAFPRRVIDGSDGRLYGAAVLDAPVFEGIVYGINRDGTGYRILHRFKRGDPPGENLSALIEGTDRALYGATSEGAANNQGAVFRINKNGTAITVLHAFPASVPKEGHSPPAPLIEGTDGALYGVSRQGGVAVRGAVFKLQKDGTGFQVLKSFTGTNDGVNPVGGLIEASDGWLYGTTSAAGTGGGGTIFKIRKDGSNFQVLVQLLRVPDQPAMPYAEMIEASDGALYGTTRDVFQGNRGTVFKLQKDGSGFAVVRIFSTTNEPGFLYAPVVEGPDGALYGVGTGTGGGDNRGTLFRMNKDGSDFRVVHLFPAFLTDGYYPVAVALGRDGSFYGSTGSGGRFGLGTLFRFNPTSDNYSTIWHFSTAGGEPSAPYGPLVPDRFGNLYGATVWGGDVNGGVIYRIHQNGTAFQIVRSMALTTNEGRVVRDLIVATDGNLYGTTSPNGYPGPGTLFKLAPDGSGFTLLQTFVAVTGDGSTPLCRITEGSDGKLYGASRWGGLSGSNNVFRINKDGTGYEILRVFGQVVGDGDSLENPLMEASDGTLYGVTSSGGTNGGGTVFRMNRDGTGYAQLHHFKSVGADGYRPSGPLLEASDGFLYGVTAYGGNRNEGTVFKVKKDGSAFAVVWRQTNWDRGLAGGFHGPLWEGNDGALYGATGFGGNYDGGVIFKINKNGTALTYLHHFDEVSVGRDSAGIVRGTDGAFYGTGGLGSARGTLYRFGQMIGVTRNTSSVQLSCTGVPGLTYEVQRSTDLQNWSTLLQGRMPENLHITYDDTSPPSSAAFYRVAPID